MNDVCRCLEEGEDMSDVVAFLGASGFLIYLVFVEIRFR